ncbi:uncharacterized protein BN750_01815 [Bacteroides sp. CAG:661]|uniref:CD225/dispanin family protein n=1 Tax=Mediterranea massiliensis TaxID=1841865 RepID=UPI00033F3EA4|nr:CD225/dispanin family protein [Mediterranea massiliensis]CCZ47441.1 uncharacterized protein BN750_01815 [Bacteroides sp. CAG:661]
MQFYILQNNIKQGPFSKEELSHQNINAHTMVWGMGFSNWKEAKDVPELSEILSCLPPEPPISNIMPKTWLVESILVTCLCCLPFGIAGIINATKIEEEYNSGKYQQALQHSKQAKKWTLWGFFTALGILLIYLLILIISLIITTNY